MKTVRVWKENGQLFQLFIDARRYLEVHASFRSEQTGLHILQVVLLRLLVVRYIAFQLELLCFQVIKGSYSYEMANGRMFIQSGGR